MDPLSITASTTSLLSAGISVCKGLLEYYNSWKDAEDGVLRMYKSIEALTKTLVLIESSIQHKSFNRDVVVRVEESIASTQRGLESLSKKLDKIKVFPQQEGWREKTKAQFRRAVFPFKESTLVKLKELGNELRDELSIALEALQIDASKTSLDKLDLLSHQVTAVFKGVESLKDHAASIAADFGGVQSELSQASANVSALVSAQNDDYLFKVYNWLSPLAGTFEKKQLDTFNLKGRQDGTGKWLLSTKEFKEWLHGAGRTLWCPGIPGAGKTVLTSFIINHIQGSLSPGIGIAYIYFNYKEVEKQTLENVIANLVHQLLIQSSLLPKESMDLYEARYQKSPSITDYTGLLRLAVQSYRKVLVVIDALDECNEADGTRKALISELLKLQPQLNLLVTSRDLPNLQRQLQDAVCLEIQASDEDIKNYIEERISSSDRLSMYVEQDPSLHKFMIDTVTRNAKGMFLQARLHLDSLTTKNTLRKLKSALNSLPEGLDKTYDEVWHRIKTQNPDDAELATRVIYWVFHAFRPLTVADIQHALAVEPGDTSLDDDNIPNEEDLVSVCAGIVLVQPESDTLGLVHYTTQEYFERRGVEHFPLAREEILRSCLTYLMFDEFSSGPCKTDEEMESRIGKRPFLKYAAHYWGDHAQGQPEESEEKLILNFLSQDKKLSSSNQIGHLRTAFLPNNLHYFSPSVPALWVTSYFGLTRIARLQLESGADLTMKEVFKLQPLDLAAFRGHDEFVRLLLDYKPDQDKISALHQAAFNGHEAVVRVLLQSGAEIDAPDELGLTALHIASHMGYENVIRLLLEQKANVFLKSGDGRSALYLAARWGKGAVMETLLQHRKLYKYNYETEVIVSALHIAATKKHDHVVKVLMENLDDFEWEDRQGRTLLHHARAIGNLDIVNQLLSRGFDPRGLDKQRRTCLHHAASAASDKVLSRLLEEGLDPNQTDIDHWTPLHWAARAGKEANVNILLSASRDQKKPSLSRWDPETLALCHGHFKVARFLHSEDAVPPQQRRDTSSTEGDQPLSRLAQLSTDIHRKDAVKALRQNNIFCDGCDHAVYGPRYKCTICEDFDFCFKCILSSHETHPSHQFEMILFSRARQPPLSGDGLDVLEADIAWDVKVKELTDYLAHTVFLDMEDESIH